MQKLVDLIDKATKSGAFNLQEVVEANEILKQVSQAINELNKLKENARLTKNEPIEKAK